MNNQAQMKRIKFGEIERLEEQFSNSKTPAEERDYLKKRLIVLNKELEELEDGSQESS